MKAIASKGNHPRISPLFLQLLLKELRKYNRDQALLQQFDLDPASLSDERPRLPLAQLLEIWQAAAGIQKDPLLGLHIGCNVHPTDYSLISHAWMSCENLLKGMYLVGSYIQLICDAFDVNMIKHSNYAEYQLLCDDNLSLDMAPLIEVSFAATFTIGRFLVGPEYADIAYFKEIHFQHSPRADIAEYERILQAPVKFNQPANSMIISDEVMLLPVRAPSPVMLKHTLKELDQLKMEYVGTQTLSDRVRSYLSKQFPHNIPTVESTAGHFNVSPSTLKRNLYKEGVSFRQLLDEVRLNEAHYLLQDEKYKLAKISEMLGFANESSFFRAFKRLMGVTPRAYRKRLQQGNAPKP